MTYELRKFLCYHIFGNFRCSLETAILVIISKCSDKEGTMFFSLVLSILGLFKSSDSPQAIVTDYPFRLCYKVTAGILFFCTSLLGLKDAFSKILSFSFSMFGFENYFLWKSFFKTVKSSTVASRNSGPINSGFSRYSV